MPKTSEQAAWAEAREILCVRLDAMGDLLMTVPAIRALRESGSDRRITLLTSPSGAEAAALIPWVDELIVHEAPWMKSTTPRDDPAPDLALIERLRRARLDAAAIFTVYSQNPLPAALLCHLAGIPLRLAHCRENPYQLLTDWVAEPEPGTIIRHEVRRQLDLVAAVGCRPADDRMAIRVPDQAAPYRRLVEGEWTELGPILGRDSSRFDRAVSTISAGGLRRGRAAARPRSRIAPGVHGGNGGARHG